MLGFFGVLLFAAACGASADIHYTATYSDAGPTRLVRLALEATIAEGYKVANDVERLHDYVFITVPERLEPADRIDVAFLVQIVFELEARQKKRFSVSVVPRAFENDLEVSEERLPVSAKSRAKALSAAIRAHARRYEAPPI